MMGMRVSCPTVTERRLPRRFDRRLLLETPGEVRQDEKMGMRVAPVAVGRRWSYHLVVVERGTMPQVHRSGEATYYVIQGRGRAYTGKAERRNGAYHASWSMTVELAAGLTFVVPPGYAHTLKNSSREPLMVVLRCPDGHFESDRFVVENLPSLQRATAPSR